MPQLYDTVALRGKFKNSSGVYTDLTDPKLTIYDKDHIALKTVTLTGSNKEATGQYKYDYYMDTEGELTYEFSGTMDSQKKSRRKRLVVYWVER